MPRADGLAKRFGVHRSTIYRYRTRLIDFDNASAIAGHKRGWKPLAARLSAKQEDGVEEAIKILRKKAGPLRVVDLVELHPTNPPMTSHASTTRCGCNVYVSLTGTCRRPGE